LSCILGTPNADSARDDFGFRQLSDAAQISRFCTPVWRPAACYGLGCGSAERCL